VVALQHCWCGASCRLEQKNKSQRWKELGLLLLVWAPKSRGEYFRSLSYIPIALRCFMEQQE
jgi:hypothetical protein